MPVEDLQEKLDIAYKKLQQAIDELCLACEKYKDLSDEIKEQIEFDKSDIFDIGYEAQYKNDYKPDLYILKKEHTIATIPNYLELYDKYVVAKKEYEELKILIEEAKKQEESIDYLDDSPAGKITSQLPIETSVLNTYRNWGINRICLDGFQNHLPQDAKGTRCYLHFMVDGKWVDRDTALANKNKITKIRFADNGVGYSLKNLKYFASVKDPEEGAAGQFGEGLKLVAMACVNRDLDFEVRSKNWVAKAFGTEETIDSYRTGERVDKEYLQLTWDIKTYSEGEIKGSRTIINKPSRELIDYALGLPERILPLSGKRPIAKTYAGNIVDTEEGERIFVKGILLRYLNHSFFSYDFDTKDINPDRNDFSYSYFLDSMIPATLQWCIGNPDVIKPLVYHLLDYYSDPKVQENIEDMKNAPIECSAAKRFLDKFNSESSVHREQMIYGKYLFRKFFIEYFDEKYKDGSKKGGVVLSNDQLPNNLKKALEDYELVRLPKDWTQVFIQAGAPYDLSIVPDMYEDRVTSPIGLDYGGESWNRERILIDGCQNHLPSDAGGKNIFVRFQTKDGTWHDHTEFSDYNDEDIVSVKISDDGIGYDYKSLGIMASTKEGEETSGKWGEGLKVIAAAAVRNGEHIRLVSRNWEAVPSITDEVLNLGKVNEKHINRLNFDVKVRTIKSEEDINPSLEKGEASATIFDNPSPELINLFKNVQDYVLMLSDKRPFVRVENTDLLDFSGGKIYVKNLLIPGEHDTLYSYHFRDFNINSRDRDSITPDEMRGLIWKFLYGLKDKRIIKLFLKDAVEYAKKTGDNPYYEFNTKFTIPNQSENSDAWIEAFKEFFGERACVRKASDQNPYFVGQAEHFGLRTITLPDFIANQLLAIESRDGKKIPSYEKLLQEALDNEFNVHEEDLTKEEKAIIEQLYSYNKILEMKNGKKDYIKKIEVYDYPPEYEGLKALGHSKLGNKVSISRETLSEGLEFATDVFIHECGHAETGAKDSAPEFRDNITSNFAAYVVRTFPIVKSVMDNGLAKGIIASRFENFLRKIFQRITYRNRVQETEPEEREED